MENPEETKWEKQGEEIHSVEKVENKKEEKDEEKKNKEEKNKETVGENNIKENTDIIDSNKSDSTTEGEDQFKLKNISENIENKETKFCLNVNNIHVNGNDINKEETKDIDENDIEEVENSIFKNKFDGKTSQLPDFAVIYSFLSLFGVYLDLPYVSITDLEQSIDSTKELGKRGEQGIVEVLHLKLFRRLNKSSRFGTLSSCQIDRLAKVILKFTQMMDLSVAWDLDEFGYHILTSAQKLLILKHLCEIQFDENVKFRNMLQEAYKFDQGASLRLSPFGYEQEGLNVWFHEDKEFNIRVYAGEDDDSSGDTWKVRAGSIEDLELYISQLKSQSEINPKDIAAEKIKEKCAARKLEREKRRQEKEELKKQREEKRKEEKKSSKGRRRGKAKQEVSEISEEETEEDEEDDGCARCYQNNQSDLVLLCDGCDAAYHTLCLRPPIMTIPDGDWYCPFCLQLKLIENLQVKYSEIRKKLLAKERQSRRLDFYGIRTANILQETDDGGGGRRRAAKRVDYNFSDYDQMINEALSDKKQKPTNDKETAVEGSRRSKRENSGSRKKLNALSSSGSEYGTSGSEYEFSESDYDGRRRRNDIKDFLVDDDYDEIEERHRNKYLRRSKRNRGKTPPRRRRRRYDDDDDSDELTESSDDGFAPRRSKRQRKTTTYYKENISDEDEEETGLNEEQKKTGDEEWKITGEEEVEEDDDLASGTEQDCDSDNLLTPQRARTIRRAKVQMKKKYVIESDEEDDDEEINYDDDDDGSVDDNGEEQNDCLEDDRKDKPTDGTTSNVSKILESEKVPQAPVDCSSRDVEKQSVDCSSGYVETKSEKKSCDERSENNTAASNQAKQTENIENSNVMKMFSRTEKQVPNVPPNPSLQSVAERQDAIVHFPRSVYRPSEPSTVQTKETWNASNSSRQHFRSDAQPVSYFQQPTPSMYTKPPPPYYNSAHQFPEPQYSSPQSPRSQNLPMRPTPMYSPHTRQMGMQHHPHYRAQHWSGMLNQNTGQYYPQAVPTNKFYDNMAHNWPMYENPHPMSGVFNYAGMSPPSAISTAQESQDRSYKKQQKEQARQEKKMQKLLAKEQKRLYRTSPPPSYHESSGAKSIGYFKNMVISSDGSPQNKPTASFPPFSPARM